MDNTGLIGRSARLRGRAELGISFALSGAEYLRQAIDIARELQPAFSDPVADYDRAGAERCGLDQLETILDDVSTWIKQLTGQVPGDVDLVSIEELRCRHARRLAST